jgi:hypothetical protein
MKARVLPRGAKKPPAPPAPPQSQSLNKSWRSSASGLDPEVSRMTAHSNERLTALPTAEEYALFREAYAETYPVRPLLNALDAKDAEIERLTAELADAHEIIRADVATYEALRLRAALETIASIGHQLYPDTCPSGCDSPGIAREALRGAGEGKV